MKKYNFGVHFYWLFLLVSFFVTTDVLAVNIGDSYEGGKVAYILQAGDTGYDVSKQKGLIVPANDQSTAIQWYNGGNFITGVTESAVGSGNVNTESLVSVLGVGSYAAMTCYNLSLNGYSDWFLPSQSELYKLLASRDTVGGYANASYWSSTEYSNTQAKGYYFFNGGVVNGSKALTYHVRCVRPFGMSSNDKPLISIPSFNISTDGSGVININALVTDLNQDISKLKIQYEPGACNYSGTENRVSITEVTADSGSPVVVVDNYQIQNILSFPSNNVNFKWNSKNDLPDVNAIACIYFTPNDGKDDGLTIYSQKTIDNKAPNIPGNLTAGLVSTNSIILNFGSISSDNNFAKYRIFYNAGGPRVLETDTELIDANLMDINFNRMISTNVMHLLPDTEYVFNIWAYDDFGNKSPASTELRVRTLAQVQNIPPSVTVPAFNAQRDGSGQVNIYTVVSDPEQGNVKLKIQYAVAQVSPAPCSYTGTENILNILSATTSNGVLLFAYGNDYVLQNISTLVNNQLEIRWNSKGDLYGSYGDYCIFITPNDGVSDGFTVSGRVSIDNLDPTIPGDLILGSVSSSSAVINFGTTTVDANFDQYKIFYRQGVSGVTESNTFVNDLHLKSIDFSGFNNTTVSGLSPNTDYVFRIWAYDTFGNKSWSTNELKVRTLGTPDIIKPVILTPASIFNSFNFFHRYFFGW